MATFADSVNALVAERDRQFVERIAKEYNLDVEELKSKYLETPVKVPRKYTKKTKEPKSVTTVVVEEAGSKDKPCCTALTSKKEPCKFSALKGEVFCKRHLKQSLGESEPKEPKAKKQTKTKKPDQPVHTHPLTETDEACDLCASHGNPLEETEQDFEVVTVARRIEALLEEAGEDDASEDDETMGCDMEEYEDEDED